MSFIGAYFHVHSVWHAGIRTRTNHNQPIEIRSENSTYFTGYRMREGFIRLNETSSLQHIKGYNLLDGTYVPIDSLKEMTRDFVDVHYFATGYYTLTKGPSAPMTSMDVGFVFANADDAALFKLRCPNDIFIVDIPEDHIIR